MDDPYPQLLGEEISLRPYRKDDREFSLQLFKEIALPTFGMVGLPQVQLEALLEQQYAIRESQWEQQCHKVERSMILDGANRVGEWYLDQREDSINLVNVALLAGSRGRGIAAALVRQLFAVAEQEQKFVSAHVMKDNPAKDIWKHLGFEIVADAGAYFRIEWHPGGSYLKKQNG